MLACGSSSLPPGKVQVDDDLWADVHQQAERELEHMVRRHQLAYGLGSSDHNDSGLVIIAGNKALCFVRMRDGAEAEQICFQKAYCLMNQHAFGCGPMVRAQYDPAGSDAMLRSTVLPIRSWAMAIDWPSALKIWAEGSDSSSRIVN